MDNWKLEVVGTQKNRAAFDLALQLAFQQQSKAVAYRVTGKGLVFYWYADDQAAAFPCPLDWKAAAEMAWHWLNNGAVYPTGQRDSDISEERGWRVYTEAWGQIDGESRAWFAVAPFHAMYGK